MDTNLRSCFPALLVQSHQRPQIFLDGPAGTQVPQSVIDAISNYYRTANANTHGQFDTSHKTDAVISGARAKCAALLNAESPDCISFGANMTTLCFSLGRGIGRLLRQGDEVLITQLDHEANRGPWLTLQNQGVIIREIHLLPDGTLDYEDAAQKVNGKTRLIAAGLASNITGTVNDIRRLRTLADDVGAMLVVDAVHAAPHFLMDVQELACDFLLCSAYKFYGPHVGILYSKKGLLEKIPVDRLRVQEQKPPYLIETGTLNHAALAGVSAAIDFIASFGEDSGLRTQLANAFEKIRKHEFTLGRKLWEGLKSIPGVVRYGPGFDSELRAPTIAFTVDGMTATQICKALGEKNIYAWDGHFYAIRAAEILGVLDKGGVVRMGIVVYNSDEEIEETIEQVRVIARG